LSREAKAFWLRNAPELEWRWLLTGLDEDMFFVLCEKWLLPRGLYKQAEHDGAVIRGPRGSHLLRGVRNRTQRAVLEGMEAFSMTSSSRVLIAVTPPRPAKFVDPMEDLLDRRWPQEDPRGMLKGDGRAS